MRIAARPVCFRLYPDGQRHGYFSVRIYSAKTAMHEAYRRYRRRGGRYQFMAVCASSAITRGDARVRHLGRLFFYRARLGGRVVTHELCHAMIQWAYWRGLDMHAVSDGCWAHAEEERCCYALGDMVAQFYYHARARGLTDS